MALQALSEVELACIEAAVVGLPNHIASREGQESSRNDDEEPLRYFDDENIFTERGRAFLEGGERILRLKLQILQLIADLFPNGEIEESAIDKLGDGSFNIVVSITLKPNAKRRDSGFAFGVKVSKFFGIPPKSRDFALRIPLDGDGETTGSTYRYVPRDIATQCVVSSRLAIPIPKIEEYDIHSKNALGRPYTLQNLVSGRSLHWIWLELSLQQKMSIIEQVTEMVEKITAVTTAAAGLVSVNNLAYADPTIALNQFPVPTPEEAKRRPSFAQPSQNAAPHQTPCEYLVDHCERWQKYEKDIAPSHNKNLWGALVAVTHSLDRRGWLGQHFHLVHGDLFPRNILVEMASSATVKITGIIDWDMACFAPKFVALRAPFWAWKGGFVDEADEDVATYEPPKENYKVLKQAFRRAASEEFIRFGLSREGAIARKFFKVVSGGLLNTNQHHLALELVEQWDALYPEDRFGDFEVV
jgi:hypothetical protein